MGWAKDQPWIDKRIGELIVQALGKLSHAAPETGAKL
jgi:hypothetical protein